MRPSLSSTRSSSYLANIYDSHDSKLWRNLYLAEPLDDLQIRITTCGSRSGRLETELQRIVRARKLVANLSMLKPGELEEVLMTTYSTILDDHRTLLLLRLPSIYAGFRLSFKQLST